MKKEEIYRAFNVREEDLPCSGEELQVFMSMFEPVVIEVQIQIWGGYKAMKKKKCSQCNESIIIEDMFIFEGKAYCMKCLFPLIMALAESGNMYIDMEDCDKKGLRIHF